eukprot:3783836-Pleurochrysis_carterae.AAC.1
MVYRMKCQGCSQYPPVRGTSISTCYVHDHVTQREEQTRRQGLRKEIRQVVCTADEGDGDVK